MAVHLLSSCFIIRKKKYVCVCLVKISCMCVCLLQARKAVILLLCGGRPFSWLIHIIATVTILGVVLLMAIFVPDIRNVFGVVGR